MVGVPLYFLSKVSLFFSWLVDCSLVHMSLLRAMVGIVVIVGSDIGGVMGIRCTMTTNMVIIFLASTAAHLKMDLMLPLLLTVILRIPLLNAMAHPTMVALIALPVTTTPPSPPQLR